MAKKEKEDPSERTEGNYESGDGYYPSGRGGRC